jgi:hypothetical protein
MIPPRKQLRHDEVTHVFISPVAHMRCNSVDGIEVQDAPILIQLVSAKIFLAPKIAQTKKPRPGTDGSLTLGYYSPPVHFD